MPGITNERGLMPLLDEERHTELDAAAGSGGGVRARIDAAKYLLDGIGGLGWSVIGFLGGAVFWHFVGFWGFVAEVVLAGGPAVLAESVPAHSLRLEPRQHWVRMADASGPLPSSCTVLVLDRRTGITSARICDSDHGPLRTDSFQGREDRIVATDGAGSRVAPHHPGRALGSRIP